MPLEAIVPAPYWQDLRQRVIGFMALGGSARAAAMRFDVSVSSAIRWAQRWRAEGHARPRAMGGDRRSRLGEHRARVLQLIAQQPDLTLQEIRGALAASCGITVGLSTVHRFLGAHNLTRKKDPTRGRAEPAPAQAGERPDVVEARRVFIRRRPALDPKRLVSTDEPPAGAGAGSGPPQTWRGAMAGVRAACGCGLLSRTVTGADHACCRPAHG